LITNITDIFTGGNDGDLGRQILEYLNERPTRYKRNSNYVTTDITRAGDANRFYFIGSRIFYTEVEQGTSGTSGTSGSNVNKKTNKKKKVKKYTGTYRIDIAMVSEEGSGLHKDPYQIFVSRVERDRLTTRRGGQVGTLRDYAPTGYRQNRYGSASGNIKTSEKEGTHKLELSKRLAKSIYERAEQIWSQTNRNVKTTARGGQPRNRGWGNFF
jgi:hypothetical protein